MIWLFTVAAAAEWVVGTAAPTAQQTVDLAGPGDTVVFPDGDWPGPVVVRTPIRLTSRGGALTGDVGTTLRIEAAGTTVDGLVVRGSGRDLQGPDACVYVATTATDSVIERSTVTDCLFGIWLHEVRGVHVEDNLVEGRPDPRPSSKGNGIHLFDSSELVIRGNTVRGARDGIYVSATEHSVISGNTVSHQRYGIHYMYSWDNTIEGNVADGNSGGIALMESRGLIVRGNVATGNKKQGILFRDVQYCTIEGNRVEGNAEGLFFFSSLDNTIVGNFVGHNVIGARVWAGTERNDVHGNTFTGNQQQVFYVAAEDQTWGPNHWSDYLGWDQDGDGLGDRPYEVDSLLATLLYTYPQASLLLSSPALELILQLQGQLPALRVPTVIDPHPLMTAPE